MSSIFAKRINCWENTKELFKYRNLPQKSLKIKYDDTFTYHKKYNKSSINFVDMDTIDCGLTMAHNPLVLNLADDCFAGGCVNMGSGAQEESLFRRTNYFQSLLQDLYPIKNDEALYSPNISIIKSSENTNWKLFTSNNNNELPSLSFIACPGIKYPHTININNEIQLNQEDVEILKHKIKLIIQIAIKFNHDTIIFGALGCGAWKNPPKHVAQIFKEILTEFDGVMLNYYFAIMNTTNDNYIVRNHNNNAKKNIEVFREVFDL